MGSKLIGIKLNLNASKLSSRLVARQVIGSTIIQVLRLKLLKGIKIYSRNY